MTGKYKTNPNFVVPEPTPADFFATFSDETTPQDAEFRIEPQGRLAAIARRPTFARKS